MGILKAVLSVGLFFGGLNAAQAAVLNCASHRNATAFGTGTGQWRLNAEIRNDYILRKASLTNMSNKNLGTVSDASRYDKRISDVRLFELKPDIFCNYEISFPRGFASMKSFQASMTMTCDDMFDGQVVLNCSVR